MQCCTVFGTVATPDPWNTLPVMVKDVAAAIRDDRVHGKLLQSIRSGQLDNNDVDLKSFVFKFHDLHIEQDVIFFVSE